jgi:tRNA (guanine-N7-)-methyltransferase
LNFDPVPAQPAAAARAPLPLDAVWHKVEQPPERYDFAALFGNDNPVEFDMGCGKGLFIRNEAQRRPHVNFIGCDWSAKFSKKGAASIAKLGLANARILCGDARRIVPAFPEHGFAALHYYFPDPWWKARHRKRRTFAPPFMTALLRTLRPGCLLHVVTDVEEYFGVMEETMALFAHMLRLPPPAVSEPHDDLDYLTHFERKYRKEGRPIWRADWRKEAEPASTPPGLEAFSAVSP